MWSGISDVNPHVLQQKYRLFDNIVHYMLRESDNNSQKIKAYVYHLMSITNKRTELNWEA